MPIPDKISPSDACVALIGSYQHAVVRSALDAAKLEPVGKKGNATLYDSADIFRAIGRELNGANARDRRDMAIAEKAEAEAARIRRDWIPVSDATRAVVELASIFLTAVHELDHESDQDARASFVEGIAESVERVIDSWIPEE